MVECVEGRRATRELNATAVGPLPDPRSDRPRHVAGSVFLRSWRSMSCRRFFSQYSGVISRGLPDSRPSSNNASSFFIAVLLPAGLHPGPDVPMESACGADINRAPKQVFEVLFEAHDIEQAAIRLPFHQQVQIALIGGLAPRHRAVHPDAPGAVLARKVQNRRLLVVPQILQREHVPLYSPTGYKGKSRPSASWRPRTWNWRWLKGRDD